MDSLAVVTDFGSADVLTSKQKVFLIPIGILFACSQLLAQYADAVTILWRTSLTLGFAYGCIFSLLPMVVLETFGVVNFAAVSNI